MSEPIKKIVLEEHFTTPALAAYAADVVKTIDPDFFEFCKQRLTDFDKIRLDEMDKYGVDMSVLSVTTPGVQIEPDRDVATRKAREVNDFLAGVIQKHPTRFAGFAHIALQDPKGAADELERAVTQLGMKGALINGHTNGEYLDDEKFWPMWERAEDLGVPIYLHPANAPEVARSIEGYPEMSGPAWAWGGETAGHTLRMIYGGVFDRFPKTTVILGHMGETLPFVLWRLDSRYAMMQHRKPIQKKPSQYIRENIMITTAGACSYPPLLCSMLELGAERIMFSIDYPYEYTEEAVRFIDNAPISALDKAKICHQNAARLLKL
jgi:2,3-dihydroxybenzoate decarboxylase